MVKNPMNLCDVPSWGDQVALDFLREFALSVPLVLKWWGNSDLYLLRGRMFASAPGSTLTLRDLQPCFIMSCRVVWNDL